MDLKTLRLWAESSQGVAALSGRDLKTLVEDIDRASNEVYEAGRKNGKVEALLTIKADEESARQEGYQAGHDENTVELRERIEKLELNTDSRDAQLLGEVRSQNRQLALQLERIEALEKQNHALNEWTCRLGDMLKSTVERTRP